MTYAEKLKDPRWQKLRLEIFERDNWSCKGCGTTAKTLHVHHEKYSGNPWDADPESLHTVCSDCHDLLTHALKVIGLFYKDHPLKRKPFDWQMDVVLEADTMLKNLTSDQIQPLAFYLALCIKDDMLQRICMPHETIH